jgi:hypothetical protein
MNTLAGKEVLSWVFLSLILHDSHWGCISRVAFHYFRVFSRLWIIGILLFNMRDISDYAKYLVMERSHSGRVRSLGKRVGVQAPREFESRSLRNISL